MLHVAPATATHTGQDRSEEQNARAEPTRLDGEAARTGTPPHGAHSAARHQTTKIENLLRDTFCPGCQEGNSNAAHCLGLEVFPFHRISQRRGTRASAFPYCISPPGHPRIWANIRQRNKTHVPPQLDASAAEIVIAHLRMDQHKSEIYYWILSTRSGGKDKKTPLICSELHSYRSI